MARLISLLIPILFFIGCATTKSAVLITPEKEKAIENKIAEQAILTDNISRFFDSGDYEACLRLDPKNLNCQYELAISNDKGQDKHNGNILKAWQALQAKKYDLAIGLATAALESASSGKNRVSALFLLAQVKFAERKYKAAAHILKEAIQVSPDNATLVFWQAEIGLKLKDVNLAKKLFLRAFELDSNFSKALYAYSEILLEEGDFEGAKKKFERLLNNPQINQEALKLVLAECELTLGDTKKAEFYLSGLSSSRAKFNLAVIKYNSGQFEESQKLFSYLGKHTKNKTEKIRSKKYLKLAKQKIKLLKLKSKKEEKK